MSGLSSIFQLFNCIVNIYKLEAYESGCCCCSFVNILLLQVVFCSRWEAELRPLFCLPARFNLPNPSLLSRELQQNSPTCCDGSISALWVWVHISLWLVYNTVIQFNKFCAKCTHTRNKKIGQNLQPWISASIWCSKIWEFGYREPKLSEQGMGTWICWSLQGVQGLGWLRQGLWWPHTAPRAAPNAPSSIKIGKHR